MESNLKVGDEITLIGSDLWYHHRKGKIVSIDKENSVYWINVTADGYYVFAGEYAFAKDQILEYKEVKSQQLPEKWYLEITVENRAQCKEWLKDKDKLMVKYVNERSKYLVSEGKGNGFVLYYEDHYDSIKIPTPACPEITIEQLLNSKQPKETMKTQKISREGLGELYQIVCNDWQNKITSIIMTDKFTVEFEVDEKLIKQAYAEANEDHLKVLNKYFKEPKKLVKKEISRWVNVYPNGDEQVYNSKYMADTWNRDSSRIACVELKGTYEIYE